MKFVDPELFGNNYYGFLVGNNEGVLNNSYWMSHSGNGATAMVGNGTGGMDCAEMDGTTATTMDDCVSDLIFTYGFDFFDWKAGEDGYPVFDRESKGFMDINNTELNVSLYPNPTSGDAKIVSDNAVIRRVTVYNLMGQTILDEEVNNTETTIRLKDVALGVYLVKICTEDGYLVKKMVVE